MTLVHLIRHGETDWNREEVFRGRADRPLSERGVRQAEALGRAMTARPLDAVYAGPLGRATQTAAPMARAHGLGVAVEPGFDDLDFGAWQGQAKAAVRERYPELWRQWETTPQDVVFPGGETLVDVERRASAALAELVRRHPDGRLAVVTHRVVLKVLVCALLDAGLGAFWRVQVDTTSISTVRFGKRGPVLESLNDTAHLAGIDDEPRLGDF